MAHIGPGEPPRKAASDSGQIHRAPVAEIRQTRQVQTLVFLTDRC